MIVEISSGKGGFKRYLEHGQKRGRELHRDQLDQRIALAGDLEVFELATSSAPGDGYKYDHITLSFSEDHVTDEVLQMAVVEFRAHALAAWPQEDRHRIAFYAEAHRPRIASYTNSHTGAKVERLTHIHIGLGKHDLLTGKSIAPLGFLGPQSDNLKYVDAWQESFNARHGLSSPKDNPKIAPEDAVDILARYTGSRPDALGTFNAQKAAFELTLQKAIIARNVTTWDGFGQLLSEYGELSKMRAGQFNECYRIKLSAATRAMRLQGVFFQRQFIERATDDKIEIITRRAKAAFLEQMQPRKAPDYLAKTLSEWHNVKARELRYLHTGSSFYKDVYQPADASKRRQLLDQIERENHAVKSSGTAQDRETAATRNRLPRLPARNLDGICRRTQILLSDHSGLDVRAASAAQSTRAGLRQTAGGGGGIDVGDTDISGGSRAVGLSPRHAPSTGQREPEIQPSSVLARLQAELRQRYEQAADKDRYAEIRRHLDCSQLLARLSHTHGLNVALYQVTSAKDGSPRIQCGSRAHSPSDFLSKQLGLPWREAAPILRQVYEHQLGKQVTPARAIAAPSTYWTEFKAEQLAGKPAVAERLKAFDAETRRLRASLSAALKIEQLIALSGLTGVRRKAELSLKNLRVVTAKAEFTAERRVLRKSFQPHQATAWRLFLQARAQAGSEEALATLRQLDDTARTAAAQAISGILCLHDSEHERKRRRVADASVAAILQMLDYVVELNGDITYSHNGRAVLRDEGPSIAVLDQNNEEVIATGLLLAREKFGQILTLTGSPEFQRRVVEVAVARGITVRFADPQLEVIRQQLIQSCQLRPGTPRLQEKTVDVLVALPVSVAVSAGVTVQPGKATPCLIDEAADQMASDQLASDELVPDQPRQQTAAQWIANAADKPAGQPYPAGDSTTAYLVVHIGLDGIVIDHGRSVASYPVPANLCLRVGDRVVVGKDQSLSLAQVPEQDGEKSVPDR